MNDLTDLTVLEGIVSVKRCSCDKISDNGTDEVFFFSFVSYYVDVVE